MRTLAPTGSVCIVDDDEQVRRFLVEVFTSVGLKIDAFACGEHFIREWRPAGAACVLLDLRMPRLTGSEVHDWLRAEHPEVPVIFLTGFADVPTAVSAMRLGAFDFLEKPFNTQHLIERAQDALRAFAQRASGEREVLDGIVAGRRNKTIASELGISERTVETHRANIMQKSSTHSVAELVALVLARSSAH